MKFRKRMMSLVLALVMAFGLTTGASAAATQNIKVQLSPNITVKLNGEAQNMADVNGNPVYPLLNGGTTYLPVRAVSNMLGVAVDWDGATQTVLLDTSKKTTPTKTDGKAPASAKPSEITVQLRPDITVKLDGKAESMTDVNGNPVYPLLNGGTTYLPIRAVSNMLGIGVDWDGATQTVLLNKADTNSSVIISPDAATVDAFFKEHGLTGVAKPSTINNPTVKGIRVLLENQGIPESVIETVIAEFEKTGPNGDNGTFTYNVNKKYTFKTSENAKVIGNARVANDYVEIDLSTASNGYVRVKISEQINDGFLTPSASIDGANTPNRPDGGVVGVRLKPGKWRNIQLPGKSDYYQLNITSLFVNVAFIATVENPDGWTLASDAYVDFENSPKTVAKAAELTKNCKTDAEKITAIFEYVAKTIKYDYQLYNDEKNGKAEPIYRNLDPDHILDTKTGVCEHYAVLMAAMLRSQGIPCKAVHGSVYDGKEWAGHVWVSVSPNTKGLDMQRLGAGHEPDGWIRLDPTWGGTASGRAKAAVDKNHRTEYAY